MNIQRMDNELTQKAPPELVQTMTKKECAL